MTVKARKTTRPGLLADHIGVRSHYLRSAHLEHHAGQTVETYIPTARALAVLRRIGRSTDEPIARAWSITGPYGAGKSSFGLFLHALVGPDGDERRTAEATLRAAAPELQTLIADGLQRLGAERGFIRAVATAQREPVARTVLRALGGGAREYWPSRLPSDVRTALRQAESDLSPRGVADAAATLAARAPVLLVIDEFGKNLEHLAAEPASSDVFLLQELAERGTGSHALPLFVVTLQHLAFDDYLRSATAAQRREWGKVQGRFEDVPFIETVDQSIRLIASALDSTTASDDFIRRRRKWAQAAARVVTDLGLSAVLPGGAGTLEACYPLHPVTVAVLPELCARFGQHGRTLFSFLASGEPHTVASFLRDRVVDAGAPLPTVDLSDVYDYFVESAGSVLAAATAGNRWLEIETRIRETPGLDAAERRCLKTIGLLNLLSQGGVLRASTSTIAYALGAGDCRPDDASVGLLRALEKTRLLTYRAFADEYRLWQGSDVDVSAEIAAARERLANESLAETLTSLHPLAPVIAARHSQNVGMLRYFGAAFVDDAVSAVSPPATEDPADGLIVLHVGDSPDVTTVTVAPGAKPVILGVPASTVGIRDAALELGAARHVLDTEVVRNDHVARREVQERIAEAQQRLREAVDAAFHRGGNAQWLLAPAMSPLDGSRGLSRLVSDVCDTAYRHSPVIRNEMLSRRELTSQGAKARRELLTAMVTQAEQQTLGLHGYGPERAMYEAVLRHTGVHSEAADGRWTFGPPRDEHLAAAWGALTDLIDSAETERVSVAEIYQRLMEPPYGLKEGPIPVLVTAALAHRQDDVAIYQDGTYQPVLTGDLLERLVKTPERFAVKTFRLEGQRAKSLAALREVVQPAPVGRSRRNASVLSIAAPLLSAVRSLPDYTRYTNNLSTQARTVRSALLDAREPDELLFSTLPQVLGIKPIRTRSVSASDVETYADRLTSALDELTAAFPRMLAECAVSIASRLDCPTPIPATRQALQERARPLQGKILEPRLRAFLLTAADPLPDDEQWIESVVLTVAGQPAVSWRDEDRARFDANLLALAEALTRLQALHFSALAEGQHGFEARRVTVTAPDGHEVSTVVWADEAAEAKLSELAATTLERARRILGDRGAAALLATIAGTVLPAVDDVDNGACHPTSGARRTEKGQASG